MNIEELEEHVKIMEDLLYESKQFLVEMEDKMKVKLDFDELLSSIDKIEREVENHANINKNNVMDFKNLTGHVNPVNGFSISGKNDIIDIIWLPLQDVLSIVSRIKKIKDTIKLMNFLHEIRFIVSRRILGTPSSEIPGDIQNSFDTMTLYTTQIEKGNAGMNNIRLSQLVYRLMGMFHEEKTLMSGVINNGINDLKIKLVRALTSSITVSVNDFDGSGGVGGKTCLEYLEDIKKRYF